MWNYNQVGRGSFYSFHQQVRISEHRPRFSSAQKLELRVPVFPCISSETPSLPPLVPTYPDQPGRVLKGWLYSLLLYDFTEPLLPAFEEQKS